VPSHYAVNLTLESDGVYRCGNPNIYSDPAGLCMLRENFNMVPVTPDNLTIALAPRFDSNYDFQIEVPEGPVTQLIVSACPIPSVTYTSTQFTTLTLSNPSGSDEISFQLDFSSPCGCTLPSSFGSTVFGNVAAGQSYQLAIPACVGTCRNLTVTARNTETGAVCTNLAGVDVTTLTPIEFTGVGGVDLAVVKVIAQTAQDSATLALLDIIGSLSTAVMAQQVLIQALAINTGALDLSPLIYNSLLNASQAALAALVNKTKDAANAPPAVDYSQFLALQEQQAAQKNASDAQFAALERQFAEQQNTTTSLNNVYNSTIALIAAAITNVTYLQDAALRAEQVVFNFTNNIFAAVGQAFQQEHDNPSSGLGLGSFFGGLGSAIEDDVDGVAGFVTTVANAVQKDVASAESGLGSMFSGLLGGLGTILEIVILSLVVVCVVGICGYALFSRFQTKRTRRGTRRGGVKYMETPDG
jgi:hypothetical protein